MKIYQVGGSVRDKILGRQAHDIDYVVVGSCIEEMLSLGYIQVGKHFPVFIHPKTKQEYALARKESCIGNKHIDFTFDITGVSLQDDLQRRDLTINSMAIGEDGNIIDYFGGLIDLQSGILRHTDSCHFSEDPLRVLRVGRFAAQLDFNINPDTLELCRQMQINTLPRDRIIAEVKKAFAPNCNSVRFVRFLADTMKIEDIFPNIWGLGYSPEYEKYHTEPNTYEHAINTLNFARGEDWLIKLGCLYHDIGKYDFTKNCNKQGHDTENMVDKYLFPLRNSLLLSKQNYSKIRNAAIYHKRIRENPDKLKTNNNFVNSGNFDFVYKVSMYDYATHKKLNLFNTGG